MQEKQGVGKVFACLCVRPACPREVAKGEVGQYEIRIEIECAMQCKACLGGGALLLEDRGAQVVMGGVEFVRADGLFASGQAVGQFALVCIGAGEQHAGVRVGLVRGAVAQSVHRFVIATLLIERRRLFERSGRNWFGFECDGLR